MHAHARWSDKSYELNTASGEQSDADADDDDIHDVASDIGSHEEVAAISTNTHFCQILSKLLLLTTERFQSSAASERKTSEDFKRNFERGQFESKSCQKDGNLLHSDLIHHHSATICITSSSFITASVNFYLLNSFS